MAIADLSSYDGSAGALVDTNVWIDCIDASSPWHDWAIEQLQICSERVPLHVNLIIFTELMVPAPDVEDLNALLDVYDTLRTHLPWSCAALTATAFALYRNRGGAKSKPMPDLFIGAHAAISNFSVLTRDAATYKSYFPRLTVWSP